MSARVTVRGADRAPWELLREPGDVAAVYLSRFEPRRVGGRGIDELWVPADELDEFNAHIVGEIELVAEYR